MTTLISQLHAHMLRSGYRHAQVDAIKDADLFLNKAGDQIIANLFTFERFGKQLALRPEFTALAVHRYIQAHPNGTEVVRWQFNGSVFRDDYATRDSHYQIMSAGAELFGMRDIPLADAEIIALATTGVTDVAGIQGVTIAIGHVGLIKALLGSYGPDGRTERLILNNMTALATGAITPDELLQQFESYVATPDSLSDMKHDDHNAQEDALRMLDVMLDATERGETMGGRRREDIVNRILKKRRLAARRNDVATAIENIHRFVTLRGSIASVTSQIATFTDDATFQQLFEEWSQTLQLVETMTGGRVQIELNTGLARDWNYYTGMVFELVNSQTGVRYGGGGRYDELVRLVGASTDVPAVGFAYNVDALVEQITLTVPGDGTMLTLVGNSSDYVAVIKWASALRDAGFNVAIKGTGDAIGKTIHIEGGNAHYEGTLFQSPDKLISLLRRK
ncbi:MAG: ATP phosphoribosyltransferase regulatory subunit [Chloroflexota bacterium]